MPGVESPKPLGQVISELAAVSPDAPAISFGGRTVTRGELEVRSNRMARAYQQLGVAQGDLVSVMLPNSDEWYVATIALWKLGAIPQPLSHRLPRRERDQVLAVARRSLVVGLDDGDDVGCPTVPPGFVPDPTLSDEPLPPAVSPSYKAPTSGGSTGVPKLILSGSSSAIPPASAAAFQITAADVLLVAGPLYHNTGLTASAMALLLGSHLVVMERFEPTEALRLIADHRVTFVSVVPTMLQRMLEVIDAGVVEPDFSSVRLVYHTAAPCPAWLKRRWIDLVGPERLWEIYGGTELQAFTTLSGVEWLAHPESVGRVLFGEMRILDEHGQELPTGEVGEIFMRPPAGNGPTYRYIGADAKTVDGWDSIGDLGYFDADGYLYISDRRTDLILIGGRNVYPAEVEAALLEHPLVTSCAIVGLPHPDLGQVPHAVVQAARPVTDTELEAYLAERLVSYKVPRTFDFVDEPLRDDAGKVRRSQVRDAALARRGLAEPRP